jgi:hypothetical protein
VRRIVQNSPEFFRIEPGLWALTECKKMVLEKFQLSEADKTQRQNFSHSYYQGLIVKIGNMKYLQTCIPAQDKNKLFLGQPLDE